MSYRRISSPPARVHWAGWESDTFRLQQAGWQLVQEPSDYARSLRLGLHYPHGNIYGISRSSMDFYMDYMREQDYRKLPPFQFDLMARDIVIERHMIHEMAWTNNWQAIDATPMHIESRNFSEIAPFRPINGEEIIVQPDTVPGLMEMILELQDPKQKKIREKMRKEARRQGKQEIDPAMNCHARIISLVR